MNTRYYILNSDYAFRGWKLLPYAVQCLYAPKTEFFTKGQWERISACDGKTEIDWDTLTGEERKEYEIWEQSSVIHRCNPNRRLHPHQEYRFYPTRFKEEVQWSITGRCNYRCRHCFMSAPHAVQGEPDWEQIITMLDAFERCGVRYLELTGGEPMVRRDFWQLMDEICSRDLVVSRLYSNGLLITDEFLDQLEQRNMYPAFQFSFDGIKHHDWMRGVTGAEKAVLDALKRCQERYIPTSVSMVVCRESVGSIRQTVNLMASLGVQSMKVGNALPQGEWLHQPEHFLSQDELYEAFLEYIPQYFEDGMPLDITLEGFFSYNVDRKKIMAFHEKDILEDKFRKATMCNHVRRGMYVSPKGKVLPCMSMVGSPIEEQFPNMLEVPLEEILGTHSHYMDVVNYRISDYMEYNPECRICEYHTACCGGCRALAVRDHPTDYLSKDLYTCAYFKGGWREKKAVVLRTLGPINDLH